jgi:hypothetical protein
MSSKSRTRASAEAWLVLTIMLLATLWYASHQLYNSLYFAYQVARLIFPGLVPDVSLP